MSKIKYFLFFLIFLLFYFFTNSFNLGREKFNFGINLDNFIPFIPGFALFYILLFPLIFIPFLIIKKEQDFINLIKANIFIIVITNILFLLLPGEIIRPQINVYGIFFFILDLIYKIDNPVNLFPSLHSSLSLLSFLIISRFKKNLRIIIFIVFISTTLSTLFIKQHYLLDILAGLFFGLTAYKIYFKRLK